MAIRIANISERSYSLLYCDKQHLWLNCGILCTASASGSSQITHVQLGWPTCDVAETICVEVHLPYCKRISVDIIFDDVPIDNSGLIGGLIPVFDLGFVSRFANLSRPLLQPPESLDTSPEVCH
jgi:hypothetical protein